ncbi:hypothetical protein [Paenibacillus sp. YYML68]|uniref:hypothetical protein n=1 Tax=Paenibacillus sp. YYML68 TaxID=2909250 RepID=UPI0024914BF4|nr:hypothetical protein [Paenibacillus sp. YYML68]
MRKYSSNATRMLFIVLLVGALSFLFTACGKSIPSIDPQLLDSKASVLVVTSSTLAPDAQQQLQTALQEWQSSRLTAYEWMQLSPAQGLTEEQQAELQQRAYDYVVVAGRELIVSLLPYAEQLTDSRWIMLDDRIMRESLPVQGSHIVVHTIVEARLHQEWDEWVRQQLVTDRAIEWVTTQAYPIPSEWAPAEEAEYMTLTDAPGWQQQLQYQLQAHRSSWIVVFAPLDAQQLQRLKAMQVPIANISATAVELQWPAVLESVSRLLAERSWQGGLKPYTEREFKLNKFL